MAYNKVIYDGKTLIDLTSDTVTSNQLKAGVTAHDKSGTVITGTCTHDVDSTDASATASEILKGKTAYARGSKVTGSMPNNGSVAGVITTVDSVYTVPQGYHDGAGTVSIDSSECSKIVAGNIRDGVTILGVLGTMSGTEGANAQTKTVVPKSTAQTITPDTEDGYNYLAQVNVEKIPYTEAENSAGGLTVTIG